MGMENRTRVEEFVFLGFSGHTSDGTSLFLGFLAAYLATMVGNLMFLTLVLWDSALHSPMYYFLSHLACLDLCLSSVIVPKILANFLRQRHTISYQQCLLQAFFVIGFAGCEPALLAAMALDRYTAICRPLHYTRLMSNRVCVQLSVASWGLGFLDSVVHVALASRLSFCGVNQIPHIFCDVPPLLKMACSDTRANEMANHITAVFVGLSPCLFIVLSYGCILHSIVQMRSNAHKRKAFSTCTSHIFVVALFFGNAFFNYNQPSSGFSLTADTLASTMFCIVTPMLNPLIYSLRNQDVRAALRKALDCQGAPGASWVVGAAGLRPEGGVPAESRGKRR